MGQTRPLLNLKQSSHWLKKVHDSNTESSCKGKTISLIILEKNIHCQKYKFTSALIKKCFGQKVTPPQETWYFQRNTFHEVQFSKLEPKTC